MVSVIPPLPFRELIPGYPHVGILGLTKIQDEHNLGIEKTPNSANYIEGAEANFIGGQIPDFNYVPHFTMAGH
jgi:hypothetical protein